MSFAVFCYKLSKNYLPVRFMEEKYYLCDNNIYTLYDKDKKLFFV